MSAVVQQRNTGGLEMVREITRQAFNAQLNVANISVVKGKYYLVRPPFNGVEVVIKEVSL